MHRATGSRGAPWTPAKPTDCNPWAWSKGDRKSTRLNSSHANISYAVFCLKKTNPPLPSTTLTYSHQPTPSLASYHPLHAPPQLTHTTPPHPSTLRSPSPLTSLYAITHAPT